jgi:hydrogenase nickel incorporation protein HypB
VHGDHTHSHEHDDPTHPHVHGGHTHSHEHDDSSHSHAHGDDTHRHVHGDPHPHADPLEPRIVAVEQDLLAHNDACAAANRRHFESHGIFAVNLVSSPGSGKTALLVRTADALRGRIPISVVEGDQQTSRDVERIHAAGIPGIQINTGKGCHLDAQMVGRAAESLELADGAVLFIENVGNLVCPAAFDLGEAHKVVIISTTEGEDKPLKYPDMFAASDLMLVNKIDLLPYLEFDVGRCIEYARRVNPEIEALLLSATTGEGLASWLEWILAGRKRSMSRRDAGKGARDEDKTRDRRR